MSSQFLLKLRCCVQQHKRGLVQYTIGITVLWLVLTFGLVGTAHLPYIGEDYQQEEDLSKNANDPNDHTLVSDWHYPNACDAALQRARPYITSYLQKGIGSCRRSKAGLIASIHTSYNNPLDASNIFCSFILQSIGKQNGWVWPISFSIEELHIARTLRRRVNGLSGDEGDKSPAKPLQLFMFMEDDSLSIKECVFERTRPWSDVVTFVTYNSQSEVGQDPLLRHVASSAGQLQRAVATPPRVIVIPHPYEWDTTIPGPITDKNRRWYFPESIRDAIKGYYVQMTAQPHYDVAYHEGVTAFGDLSPFPQQRRFKVVWRGVTTGDSTEGYYTSDRYRTIITLQREQLRRTLEAPEANAMIKSYWESEEEGTDADPANLLLRINNISLKTFPVLDFADVCFTRTVQGVRKDSLALSIIPRPPTRVAIEGAVTNPEPYFMIQDNFTHKGPQPATLNLNIKPQCSHRSPDTLLQTGLVHLDVDGNGNAWEGLRWKLCSGAVVVKVASSHGYYQWYYDKLINGTHLIVVPADAIETSLIPTIEAVVRDEGLMTTLSRNALAFCKEQLEPEAVHDYFKRLF